MIENTKPLIDNEIEQIDKIIQLVSKYMDTNVPQKTPNVVDGFITQDSANYNDLRMSLKDTIRELSNSKECLRIAKACLDNYKRKDNLIKKQSLYEFGCVVDQITKGDK